jgi:hypothetical protein
MPKKVQPTLAEVVGDSQVLHDCLCGHIGAQHVSLHGVGSHDGPCRAQQKGEAMCLCPRFESES